MQVITLANVDKREPEKYLLLHNLNNIFVLKYMLRATSLWVMLGACAPHKHVLDIFQQAAMNVITKIFHRAASSILQLEQHFGCTLVGVTVDHHSS